MAKKDPNIKEKKYHLNCSGSSKSAHKMPGRDGGQLHLWLKSA